MVRSSATSSLIATFSREKDTNEENAKSNFFSKFRTTATNEFITKQSKVNTSFKHLRGGPQNKVFSSFEDCGEIGLREINQTVVGHAVDNSHGSLSLKVYENTPRGLEEVAE